MVAQQASFSKAAKKLFITQPAVSKRIATLEKDLDTQLFDRINKTVNLTEAGRALLPRAKQLLDEAEDMKRFASTLSSDIHGPLTIGTSHHIGLHRLPPALRQFNTAYTAVELNIQFMDSEKACRAIETGELELAIVTLPREVPEMLHTEAIWTDHLQIMVDKDHPLAGESHVPLRKLVQHACILPSEHTYTYHILHQAIMKQALQLKIRMSTNYLETLKMLISAGFGWSLLPHTMKDNNIVVLNTEFELQRELGIVIHKKRTLSNAAQAMIDVLRSSE